MQETQLKSRLPEFATLLMIADSMGVPVQTLKIKLTLGRQSGVPLPNRRRLGKCYLYNTDDFLRWLWENADVVRRKMPPIKRGND